MVGGKYFCYIRSSLLSPIAKVTNNKAKLKSKDLLFDGGPPIYMKASSVNVPKFLASPLKNIAYKTF